MPENGGASDHNDACKPVSVCELLGVESGGGADARVATVNVRTQEAMEVLAACLHHKENHTGGADARMRTAAGAGRGPASEGRRRRPPGAETRACRDARVEAGADVDAGM